MAFARVQQKGEKTRVVQLSASDTEGLENIELGKTASPTVRAQG